MSVDVSSLPEVRRLIEAANNALALERQMGRGGDASQALRGIFQDLGRVVHRAIGAATVRVPTSDWEVWAEDLEDEPTVIDIPDEDEDAGLVMRTRGRG